MESINKKKVISEECSYLNSAFDDLIIEGIQAQETYGYCKGFTEEENLKEIEE